ncbi:toxin-activating lysine-acyltransferase [Hyphomicrobium sp.]|uniref:toxin-activating lysine-acyltransferase n=1 Tax=Hyphomicrobium sp. TaxID=82 RepID=UPI002E3014AB|nr:toxin-activating lysine-acyltransferase [Hyphomicrobium sp.]
MIVAKQSAAALGEIVSVLMRSPTTRQHQLSELEWMVMPAIKHGQFLVAHSRSKTTGAVDVVGFVLWALVSPEVDKKLGNSSAQLRLAPAEWKSGDIPWIIAGAGEPNILGGLIGQLKGSVFQGREIKMRVQGPDGRIIAGPLVIPEPNKKTLS